MVNSIMLTDALNMLRKIIDYPQDPPAATLHGNMIEAFIFNQKGMKMAYALCINQYKAADGTVLFTAR